jgi:hypothetical protein
MPEVRYRKTQDELMAEQLDIKREAYRKVYGEEQPEPPAPEPVDPEPEDPDAVPPDFPVGGGSMFTTVHQYRDYRDRVLPERERRRAEENRRAAEERAEVERQRMLRVQRLRESEAKALADLAAAKENVSGTVDTLTKSVKDVDKARSAARQAAQEGGLLDKVNELLDALKAADDAAENAARAHAVVAVAEGELELASYRAGNPELRDDDFAIQRMEAAAAYGRSGTAIRPTAAELLINAGLPGHLYPSAKAVGDALARLREGLDIT